MLILILSLFPNLRILKTYQSKLNLPCKREIKDLGNGEAELVGGPIKGRQIKVRKMREDTIQTKPK